MPKSRGRKTSKRRQSRHQGRPRDPGQLWSEMGPWARAMMQADEAETRGDARAALKVMESRATGPDGEFFWRQWRAKYLFQFAVFGSCLPSWAVSRWILNQAAQCLDPASRSCNDHAIEIVIELRGGVAGLPGVDELDAKSRVMDRDWVHRQLVLYELGGLEHFIRRVATPALLARADDMRAWAGTPMGGFRLVGCDPATVTWLDLGTGEPCVTANIGSAALVHPGEHVIGRLAPTRDDAAIFETAPLVVPKRVARAVSDAPDAWLDVLGQAMTEPAAGEDPIVTHGRHHACLISDVPASIWGLALLAKQVLPEPGSAEDGTVLAERVLAAAAREIARSEAPPPGEIDVWPCVGAALLEPYIFRALPDVASPADAETLDVLGSRLAEPAALVCRGLAALLAEVA